jgi:hypothetical protein
VWVCDSVCVCSHLDVRDLGLSAPTRAIALRWLDTATHALTRVTARIAYDTCVMAPLVLFEPGALCRATSSPAHTVRVDGVELDGDVFGQRWLDTVGSQVRGGRLCVMCLLYVLLRL